MSTHKEQTSSLTGVLSTRIIQSLTILCHFLLFIRAEDSLNPAESCSPLDYTRIATKCHNGQRNVSYVKRRTCVDILPLTSHVESCTCALEDYRPVYEWGSTGEKAGCTLRYQPEGCIGGKESQALPVADFFCAANSKPCTPDDVRYTYTSCDYTLNSTFNSTLKPTRKVIYYFEDVCNPDHVDSIKLPHTMDISCDLQCGAGFFLNRDACKPCSPGSFSVGGGLRWDSFETLDPKYFKTKCFFMNSTTDAKEPCTPWLVKKGMLTVGPYDKPNDLDSDDCHDDLSLQCHNNLHSYLTFTVTLIRDGYVTFNFTVDSERRTPGTDEGDGLRFYIDDLSEPVMEADSEFGSKQVGYPLAAGYHTLTWEYMKDDETTKGADNAFITFLEINGTDLYDSACTPCHAGYISSESADVCTPCPIGFFTDKDGASECMECPDGQYSLELPRTSCKARPVCDLSIYISVSYSPCKSSGGKNTRKKIFKWLEPKVCTENGGSSLPAEEEETCPPCDHGQREMVDHDTQERMCIFCPEGSALSGDGSVCERCSNGTVALKWLNYTRFDELGGNLPPSMTTGCEGDCGVPGWHVVNAHIDSGIGHGSKVKVWLEMNFTLEVEGSVDFTYSIISWNDFSRFFDYYVDGQYVKRLLMDDDIDDDDMEAGALPEVREQTETTDVLPPGNHSLRFVYSKIDNTDAARDTVEILSIRIRGEKTGGAGECVPVPGGNEAVRGGSSWRPCPPGTYGPGGASPCVDCPANTYNSLSGSAGPCSNCALGTTSAPGSSECFVGDISSRASFCTYEPDVSKFERQANAGNQSQWLPSIFYDLSPLALKHADDSSPFSLVPEVEPTRATFSISVCNRVNHTYCSYDRKPRFTYACRVDERTSSTSKPEERSDSHYSHDLAESVQLLPLGDGLEKRGLIMQFQAAGCLSGLHGKYTKLVRRTELYFICDPSAGYGQPEAWGQQGKKAALNPSAEFPWRQMNDTKVPIQMDRDGCSFSLVWYSLFACPLCTQDDVVSDVLSDCPGGIRRVFRYKQPQTCAPNPFEPLPPSVACSACTADDWQEVLEHCIDSQGKRNVSYQWKHPQNCSELIPGSLPLPPPVLAGPCAQNVTVGESGSIVSWSSLQILLLIGALSLGVIVLGIVAVVACMQKQHMYSNYAKLAQTHIGDFELTAGHVD